MRKYSLLVSLICSVVTASAADVPPDGSTLAAPVISALLYDEIGVPISVLEQATQLVTSIYGRAGVDVAWRTCLSLQTGRLMLDDCKRHLNADELVVRIKRPAKSSLWRVRASALGVALVLDGIAGYYVSVFYGRIEDLAESQRVRPGLVLGYAIAHEVGHLLLRSTAHSELGLMRGAWDSESRKQAERGRLYFLSDQSKRVREEAAMRAAAASTLRQQQRTEN